jgi:hypothetical protein
MRKSFAGRLHEAMSAASRRASSRTEALFLSVREMVDRIGFEPLTSAVCAGGQQTEQAERVIPKGPALAHREAGTRAERWGKRRSPRPRRRSSVATGRSCGLPSRPMKIAASRFCGRTA